MAFDKCLSIQQDSGRRRQETTSETETTSHTSFSRSVFLRAIIFSVTNRYPPENNNNDPVWIPTKITSTILEKRSTPDRNFDSALYVYKEREARIELRPNPIKLIKEATKSWLCIFVPESGSSKAFRISCGRVGCKIWWEMGGWKCRDDLVLHLHPPTLGTGNWARW